MSTLAQNKNILDVAAVRKDFPILATQVHGKPLVYLDNAATAQKPRAVIDALTHFYETSNANIHRGVHALSEAATAQYEAVREQVREFIHAASPREIIFTRNATEALNLVAQSYGRAHLQPGDEILVSTMEHHSNLVPWQLIAAERGATVRAIPVHASGALDLSQLDTLLTKKTRIVAITMLSNVMGSITPIRELAARAHSVGAVLVVDAAQGVVHLPINVEQIGCDFLAFSSHKLYGPTGVGVLYGREKLLEAMPPFLGGGEMIDHVEITHSTWAQLPHKFEAGTPNIADVIAFGAALSYLQNIGMEKIRAYETSLTHYAVQQLSRIDGLTIYGPGLEDLRDAVIAFNLGGLHPHDVSQALDFDGIAIRAGHHCCQPLMRALGVVATNRASLAFYNTAAEIDFLVAALKKTKQFFGSAR